MNLHEEIKLEKLEEKETVKIAKMYYEEGMTQAQIAKVMGVSRSLISKILLDAKNNGIVEVFIHSDTAYSVDLERKLEEKFNLHNAIVLDTRNLTQDEIIKSAGQQSALYLTKLIKTNKKIGISWGHSLRSMVDSFPFTGVEDTTLFPLIGGMSDAHFDIHSNQLCYDLGRKMRAEIKYLYAPASVSNPTIKKELADNKAIKSILDEAKNVELALLGISSPYENSSMLKIGYIDKDDIKLLKEKEVIGDINSKFFTIDGVEADIAINDSVIGLGLDDIKQIPLRMSIAIDKSKIDALKVALKKELLNIIVTTDEVAKEVLKH